MGSFATHRTRLHALRCQPSTRSVRLLLRSRFASVCSGFGRYCTTPTRCHVQPLATFDSSGNLDSQRGPLVGPHARHAGSAPSSINCSSRHVASLARRSFGGGRKGLPRVPAIYRCCSSLSNLPCKSYTLVSLPVHLRFPKGYIPNVFERCVMIARHPPDIAKGC
jgi:hypothetical protein